MKRRLLPLLLSLILLFPLLPAAPAQGETPSVTALCVAEPGQSAFLDAEEFRLLCRQATGHDLESVTFSLLPGNVGTLTLKGKTVTPDVIYYPDYDPLLSQILFVPSSRFSGQAKLPFTLTSVKDETVSGSLILYVLKEEEDVPDKNLVMDKTAFFNAGEPFSLLEPLPDTVWYKERGKDRSISGGKLTSAVFTRLPLSAQGALWLDYGDPSARKVLPGETLYRGRDPNLYSVTFVPAGGEAHKIRLDLTVSGKSVNNVPCRLTLIRRETPIPADPSPVTVSANADRVSLSAALHEACAQRNQGGLQTVSFDTLPAAGEGTIFSEDTPVTVGRSYPYNTLTFLPGDGFQGGITLGYEGSDSKNATFSGSLTLALDYPAQGRFQDLAGWEWASYAVRFLDVQKAVPYSRNDPSFRPGDSATRMELIYALVQVAYPNAESAPAPGFSDLPADKALSGAAAVAAAQGLLLGDEENRMLPDSQVTRQDALVLLHRALTDLNRPLPDPGELVAFSDAGDLASYAQEAAAVLSAKGILRGDGAGSLNPLSPITRAEMACLLYRAFSE